MIEQIVVVLCIFIVFFLGMLYGRLLLRDELRKKEQTNCTAMKSKKMRMEKMEE